MNLPMIPHDKANHFIYGLLITAIILFLYNLVSAILVCVLLAVSKEIYDINRSGFNWKDLLFTLLGGTTAILISFLKL
jgi:hypothetical protein